MSTLSEIDEKFQAEALAVKTAVAESLYESLFDSSTIDLMKIQRIENYLAKIADQKELLEFLQVQTEKNLTPTDKDKLARIRGSEDTGSHNRFREGSPKVLPRRRF